MKRLATVAFAAALALGSFTSAQAAEVEFKGEYVFTWAWMDNADKGDSFTDQASDHFTARQRVRLQTEFKATDYLKGVIQTQVSQDEWGSDKYKLYGNGEDFHVRRAYIDWTIPDSCLNFKIGLADMALPSATFGNPVMAARAAGIQMNIAFTDDISANVFWLRPRKDTENYKANDFDMFGFSSDFNFDAVRVQPWAAYGSLGANSKGHYSEFVKNDDRADIFWGGVALEVNPIDQLAVKLDAMYGYIDFDAKDGNNAMGVAADSTQGWLVSLAVDYEMDFGTPGLFAWYGSGNKEKAASQGKFGTLPVLAPNGFGPTSFGSDGAFAINNAALITQTGAGTWGVGLQVADMSFIEKVSHTVRVAYIGGTNHKNTAGKRSSIYSYYNSGAYSNDSTETYMTHHDHAIEFNIDTLYHIYDNLDACLELGYIISDFDNGSAASKTWDKDHFDDNAIKVALGLRYSF